MANYGGNIIGGMGVGAAAGGTAAGPYGALAGGVIGGLTGLFSSIAEENDQEERQRALKRLARQLGADYQRLAREFNDWYEQNKPAGTAEDRQIAADKIRNFDASKYDWMNTLDADGDGVVSRDEFNMDYNKDVKDFLNPYMDDVVDYVGKQARETAGGALMGRSTGATNAMVRAMAKQEDELYNTALKAWQDDRDFQYKQWSDYNSAMQDRLKGLMEADQWQIGQQKALGDEELNWQAQKFQGLMDMKQAGTNAKYQLESGAWI